MFKNRAFQVKVVKDTTAQQDDNVTTATATVTELIEKISKVNVTRVVIGAVAVYAAVVAINTGSEIAINAAPHN